MFASPGLRPAIFTLKSIHLYYNASEPLFVGKGESASFIADKVEDEENIFLFGSLDYKYEGLNLEMTETVTLRPRSAHQYKLSFTNKAGTAYNVPFVASNETET